MLEAFEAGTLYPFTHREHIQVAWLYLRRDGWDIGYRHIQQGIQHFASVNGHASLYHETITRFWAVVIHHAIHQQPHLDDFDEFIAAFPWLMDKTVLTRHYSAERLKAARQTWMEPDLKPIPE
jgi:hypothetical protein